jgi:choline dehydrogenase-like flavoprotein
MTQGRIIEGKEIREAVRETADVCVIGSGAGGAVVAKELAERGAKVVVLEEGGTFSREHFTGVIKDSMAKLYRNFGLDATAGIPSVIVPTGKCLGGTTVINMGTCFRAPARVLEAWKAQGLSGYSEAELSPYYDRVEKITNVQEVKPEVMGRNGEIIAEGARRLGLHPHPIRRNVSDDCKGCGNCAYGCQENAKQAMILNYIPLAVQAGATFYCDTRAETIVHDDRRIAGISAKVLDRETGDFRHHAEVAADVVVVAAGALNTPALFLKNKLANRSGQVGRNLKLHLCSRVVGIFDQVIDAHHGVCQSLYIDDYQDQGIMLEATFTGPGTQLPGLPGFGRELWELTAAYGHMASIGVMVSDTSAGRVRADGHGNPIMSYNVNQEDAETIKKAALISARILFAAGAKSVVLSGFGRPVIHSAAEVEKLQDHKAKASDFILMAFHPMGTCRMGAHRKSSVVDANFETHDLRNLFIADASVFPTSLGVNPQETIFALATKCADYIAGHVL